MKRVIRDPEVLDRMQMTFELYEVAEAMKRQNERRRHPGLDDAEVERRVLEWLYRRPGVERGDADGDLFALREPRK